MSGERIEVRDATEADLEATVELIAAHRGGNVDSWRRLFSTDLHDAKRHFVVASIDGRVIGLDTRSSLRATTTAARPVPHLPVGTWRASRSILITDVAALGRS